MKIRDILQEQGVAEGSGNWYVRVRGKVLKDKKFNAIPFPSKETATQQAFEIHRKKQIPLEMIKLTQSWMDSPEQGVSEGHADQQRKIFKKNGQPVGEVGIDRESSPGVGQYYMKHYASGTDLSGYDSFEDALAELRHVMKQSIYGELREQGVAEEGYGTHPSQRVDPRTGKKYVPPKSPLGEGVAEGDRP